MTPEREAEIRQSCGSWGVRELLAEIDALRQENAQLNAVVPIAVKEGMLKVGQELLDTAARVRELEQLMVTCALPYEALLMDGGSRKWIAPSIWKLIEETVAEIRAALAPTQRDTP